MSLFRGSGSAPMGYKTRMIHSRSALVLSVGLLGLLPLTGCSKIRAALGKGDAGESASAALGGKGGVGPLAFLNGFEGEIDILAKGHAGSHGAPKPATPSPDVHVAVLMKSGKIRVDVPPGTAGTEKMGKMYGIFDSGEKKAYGVMDAQKQAIMIDLNKTGEHLQNASHSTGGGPTAPTKPPPKVTKTGKTDTVAGYTCEIWDMTDETTHATMCIAEEGFSLFHIPLTGAPAEYAWMSELMDGKHIPLRVISFDKAGAEEGRVEITKIDKKSEPDANFQVPAGYKIVDFAEMLKGGAAGAGGPPGGFPGGAHAPPHH